MKVNVTKVLTNFDGTKLKEKRIKPGTEGAPEEELVDLTLRSVLCQALVNLSEEDRVQPGAKKVWWFLLAQQIHEQDMVELKPEDVTDLKRMINLTFPVPVVARAWMAIDPTEKPEKTPGALVAGK